MTPSMFRVGAFCLTFCLVLVTFIIKTNGRDLDTKTVFLFSSWDLFHVWNIMDDKLTTGVTLKTGGTEALIQQKTWCNLMQRRFIKIMFSIHYFFQMNK